MTKAFYVSGNLELCDAGASGGLLLEVRFSVGDGRGEDACCVELEPAEVADLHQALSEWLRNHGLRPPPSPAAACGYRDGLASTYWCKVRRAWGPYACDHSFPEG